RDCLSTLTRRYSDHAARLSRIVHSRLIPASAPPLFSAIIHHGAIFTDRLQLRIEIEADPRARYYRISERPDLDGTPLFPIGDGVVVFDHPRLPEESATLTLWIDVVTVLGVSSGAEPFMIHYDPNGDHDGDRTANSRDPDDDGDGLSDAE